MQKDFLCGVMKQFTVVPTYGHEVFVVPGLQLGQGAAVQQQSVSHVSDELQSHMAFKTWHYGMKPSIAIAMETVLVLLALGALKLRRALASWGREGKKKDKIKWIHEYNMCFFLPPAKKWKHHLDFNSDAPPSPPCIIVLFQLFFFFFPLPSPSLVVFPPQTVLPFGYFSLTPSVSLMQMFSLVTKPRGEFTAWLGSSTLRIATHPSTHLFLCFLSKFSLSSPPSLGFWILNHPPTHFSLFCFRLTGSGMFPVWNICFVVVIKLIFLSKKKKIKAFNTSMIQLLMLRKLLNACFIKHLQSILRLLKLLFALTCECVKLCITRGTKKKEGGKKNKKQCLYYHFGNVILIPRDNLRHSLSQWPGPPILLRQLWFCSFTVCWELCLLTSDRQL